MVARQAREVGTRHAHIWSRKVGSMGVAPLDRRANPEKEICLGTTTPKHVGQMHHRRTNRPDSRIENTEECLLNTNTGVIAIDGWLAGSDGSPLAVSNDSRRAQQTPPSSKGHFHRRRVECFFSLHPHTSLGSLLYNINQCKLAVAHLSIQDALRRKRGLTLTPAVLSETGRQPAQHSLAAAGQRT